MADVGASGQSTPEGFRPETTPEGFRSRRDYDLTTAATLHEIQIEQGRILEKISDLAKAFDKVGTKVDALTTTTAVLDTKVTPLGPKVDAHNRLYWIVIGASAILTTVVAFAWHQNSDRFNRLLKILDNPAIERFVNRKPVPPRP